MVRLLFLGVYWRRSYIAPGAGCFPQYALLGRHGGSRHGRGGPNRLDSLSRRMGKIEELSLSSHLQEADSEVKPANKLVGGDQGRQKN